MKKIFSPSRYLSLVISFLLFIESQTNAQQFSSSVLQFIAIKEDTFALTHANLVDGTGSPAKADQTIIIIKGRIAKVGTSSAISVPQTAEIIDCSGKTIIPGMVMM